MARLAVALLALALVACGSVSRTPAGTPPPGAATPAGGQVMDSDDGRTFALKVGDQVEVVLHQQPGYTQWNGVQSSDRAVLMPVVDTHAAAVRGVTLAMFRAAAPGQADITASAGPDCTPGTVCAQIARLWKVSVRVLG